MDGLFCLSVQKPLNECDVLKGHNESITMVFMGVGCQGAKQYRKGLSALTSGRTDGPRLVRSLEKLSFCSDGYYRWNAARKD